MTTILTPVDPLGMPDRKCSNCDYLACLDDSEISPDYECRRFAVEQDLNQTDSNWYVGHPKVVENELWWCGEFKRTGRDLPLTPNGEIN